MILLYTLPSPRARISPENGAGVSRNTDVDATKLRTVKYDTRMALWRVICCMPVLIIAYRMTANDVAVNVQREPVDVRATLVQSNWGKK